MRMIDADALKQYINKTDLTAVERGALLLTISNMPTLTPPNEPLTPCDVCKFSPPSSSDGKPCCMCPAERRPPEGDCEIKDYTETCEECRFCDNTPASPPEGEEDT